MSELMMMQQEYLDWLNQSRLYRFLPFIILSSVVLLSATVYTKTTPLGVMLIAYNPLSLFCYWALGVVPFITVPFLLCIGFICWVIISIRKLKLEKGA
jgi:hypothetical protein